MTVTAAPSCPAGVSSLVAVTTTGSTIFVSGFAGGVSGFGSCAPAGPAASADSKDSATTIRRPMCSTPSFAKGVGTSGSGQVS